MKKMMLAAVLAVALQGCYFYPKQLCNDVELLHTNVYYYKRVFTMPGMSKKDIELKLEDWVSSHFNVTNYNFYHNAELGKLTFHSSTVVRLQNTTWGPIRATTYYRATLYYKEGSVTVIIDDVFVRQYDTKGGFYDVYVERFNMNKKLSADYRYSVECAVSDLFTSLDQRLKQPINLY